MSLAFWVYLAVFVVFLACGAPIYMALLSSGLSYAFLHGGIDNMAIMAKMYGSLDSFVLLAIPMFMAAGIIMNNGGITDRIFNFCRALLGHLPGGLAYVNVLASFLFSGMSGSALADVGGLGSVEIKAMRDEGYDDDTIFGITAASVSVGTLFTAGVGPGLAIGLILCIAVFIVAKRRGYKVHKRATLREVLHCIRRSFFALLLPAIIMGGIMCGYFTPTEASCIAITYCILVVCFIYRDMPFRQLLRVVNETVSGIVPALAIVSSASLFGWVLQFEHLGEKMYNGITSLTDNKWVILLIIDVILLFFGMILDSTPTIMLLVPIFQPLTQAVGISPIHLGVIVVLNLMIGLMTPPYGQSLFMLSGTTGVHFNKIVKYVMPWLLPMFIALLAVTFIEPITLAIPIMLGFTVF